MPTPFATVLFDLDDTLIHSDLLRVAALHSCGHPNPGGIPLGDLRTQSPRDLMRPHREITMPDYWRIYLIEADANARLGCRGLDRAVQELSRCGIALGVVTSSPHCAASRVLQCLGICDLFPVLIGWGDCRKRKPHGDPILLALSRLGADASTSVYIGDSVRDLEASRNAGVAFGLATWCCSPDAQDLVAGADALLGTAEEMLVYVRGGTR